MVSYKLIIFLFISGKFTTVLSLRNLAELTHTNDTHQLEETPPQVKEHKGPEVDLKSQNPSEQQQEQQQQESQVQETLPRVDHPTVDSLKQTDPLKVKPEGDLEKVEPPPTKPNQEHTVDGRELSTEGTKNQVINDPKEIPPKTTGEPKNDLQGAEGDSVTQNDGHEQQNAKLTQGSDNHREGSDGHREEPTVLRDETGHGAEEAGGGVESGGVGGPGGKAAKLGKPEPGTDGQVTQQKLETSEKREGDNNEDGRVNGELGAPGPALERGGQSPQAQLRQLPESSQEPESTDSRAQLPKPGQVQVNSTGDELNSVTGSGNGDPRTGPTVSVEPQVTRTTPVNSSVNTVGNVLPPARREELPSRASDSLIHPLTPDEPVIKPAVGQQTGVGTAVRSQTKQVPINPLANNNNVNSPNSNTGNTNPGTTTVPPTPTTVTPPPTPTTVPTTTTPMNPVDKDDGVRNVLMSVLRELERSLDEVNETELSRPETPNKQSLCDVLNTTSSNICQANSNPANAGSTGAPVNPELLGLVNRYYVNNACVTENSLNQMYNSGDFSYKLLAKHLAQFSKKAPNQTVQTVYDKSVPVVTKLTELFKGAETALVSDPVKKLLEKRYKVLTTALCGVANNQQDFLSSTELNNNHATLSLNEEDFINQSTKELMKAYEPMSELLREFNTLLPRLFELFEEGFENKINLVSSLAHVKPKETGNPGASGNINGNASGNSNSGNSVNNSVGNGVPVAHALIQYVDDQDREIAAVHGHPSLIQRLKSLLQINSPDPQHNRPNVPVPNKPGELHSRPNEVSNKQSGPVPSQKSVPPAPVDGLRLLDRASPGGVHVDQHTPKTATSGLSQASGTQVPGSPGAVQGTTSSSAASIPPVPGSPVVSDDHFDDLDVSEGMFGGLKRRLKSLVSNSPGPAQPSKKVQHEIDDELLTAAYAQFEHLGLFKTKNGKLVPELDEQKVKTLVRSNLLSLNEFDSMYNLVIGPQRSIHGLYEFVEHLLLSPDADEKISALNDKKLMEQINKIVSPLEDLYEQVKSNSKDLRLKMPEIPAEEDTIVKRTKRGAAEHRPSTAGSSFQVVSNSSGVKVSQEGQLAKIKNIFKPLLGNGMMGSTWFVLLSSVLILLM